MKNSSKSQTRIDSANRQASRRASRELLATAALLLSGLAWLTSTAPSLADDQPKASSASSAQAESPSAPSPSAPAAPVPPASPADANPPATNSPPPADKVRAEADEPASTPVTAPATAPSPSPAPANADARNSTGPRSLSVAPEADGASVRFDRAKRPKWVEAGPIRKGDRQTLVVTSEPRITRREALLNLDEELLKAARDYLSERLGDPRAALEVPLVADDVRSRVGSDDLYEELIEVSVGPMYQAHARIQFDETFLDTIRSRWQAAQLGRRVINLGGLLTGVTAALGGIYLVLRRGVKKDVKPEATRGLHGAAVSAILSFVSASVGLAISTPWV